MIARPVLLVAFLLAACGDPNAWRQLDATQLSLPQQRQKTKAEAARTELGKALLGRLTESLAKGAPGAIATCRDAAPTLSYEVGKTQGVKIGRTSLQLRNQRNAAPAWAKAHIEQAKPEAMLFAGPGRELGALYPITLQTQCLQCHGAPAQIAPEVLQKVKELYPEDRATGFAEGALRGWFWVQRPAS